MVQAFGHSYLAGAVGSADQTGRFDSLLCAALGIDFNNRRNHALSGSILSIEGRGAAGWCRVFYECKPTRTASPYTSVGGLKLFCYGINDLGFIGSTALVQMRAAWIQATRACISRARASAVKTTSDASIVFGAGFTPFATGEFTGPNFYTSTTSATGGTNLFTITLPADYKGEPVAICLLGVGGAVGGTVTWSGTAGVTGTTSTSDIMPAATLSRCPVVKRVTNLTSANAGQTIIGTVTQCDSGGSVWVDSWWLESLAPSVTLVCDINRLTAAGYAGYASWTGTEAQKDNDVAIANQMLRTMVHGEFDDAVKIVPIDEIVGKDAGKTSDGIHLNEVGASLATDAMLVALDEVGTPSIDRGSTATLNSPSERMGSLTRPRPSGNWFTTEFRQQATAAVPVAGTMWAYPFQVTAGTSRYVNFCCQVVATSGTGSAIRWGIYNDYQFRGYPQFLEFEATSGGAFAITTALGVKTSPNFTIPASATGMWVPDPGVYWIAFKFTTVLASQTFTTLAGPNMQMPQAGTTGAMLSASTHPVAYSLAGQGTTALPTIFPSGASLSDNAPYVGIKVN